MTRAIDCKHDVDIDELYVARDMCCDDLPMDSSPKFIALAELIMTEEGVRMPENANDASTLYLTIVNEIEKLMYLHIYENGLPEMCRTEYSELKNFRSQEESPVALPVP